MSLRDLVQAFPLRPASESTDGFVPGKWQLHYEHVRNPCQLHRAARETPGIGRPRLITTTHGTRPQAFGPVEWGLLVVTAVIWGSSFLWIEYGLESFRPPVVTTARVALGVAALAVIPAARRTKIERADWPRVVVLALTWMSVPLLLFPVAQRWIDSSVAGMINGAVPLTTALVTVLVLRSLPGRVQLAGLLVGFAGVVCIAWPSVKDADATAFGFVLCLGAVFLYGIGANVAVPLQQRYGALPVLLRALLVALAIVAPVGLAALPGSEWSTGSAAAMLPLGLLGTGWAYVAFATLSGRAGATRGAVAIYFTPVVAIVLGVVVRDEHVAAAALFGTLLVMLGAWLTSRGEAGRLADAVEDAEAAEIAG
jgi:drug/metabolite transporter (DMT)-like permease